jgi:hypothetical protein
MPMYDNAEELHLLDLCILAYHLYSQTLYWPLDPYYEQSADDRVDFMNHIRQNYTPTKFPKAQFPHLSGPGAIRGLPTNPTLDPIICDYSLMCPWRPSVTRPNAEKEGWIVFDTPRAITDRIGSIAMFYHKDWRTFGNTPPGTAPDLQAPRPNAPGIARDVLCCFEGGTGGMTHGLVSQTAAAQRDHAWSMMGFVLARHKDETQNDYDVYIVFRGSRSGELRKTESLGGRGNPDWVTNLNSVISVGSLIDDRVISPVGKVCNGFSYCVSTMLHTIMECLAYVQIQKGNNPPQKIYVTAHSLGSSLAVHFTSAMLMGEEHGFQTAGTKMPQAIRAWPWAKRTLITFAQPPVGNKDFTVGLENFSLDFNESAR